MELGRLYVLAFFSETVVMFPEALREKVLDKMQLFKGYLHFKPE